jgi:hypothetical protein
MSLSAQLKAEQPTQARASPAINMVKLGMRTTVDIPDPIYRRLKSAAALRGCSIKKLILRGVKIELEGQENKRKKKLVKLPVIESKKPGWLRLTNKKINEVLFP